MDLSELPLFTTVPTTAPANLPPPKKPAARRAPSDSSPPRRLTAAEPEAPTSPSHSEDAAKPRPPSEPARPLSVSQLTQQIRSVIEPNFSSVCVVGEISNFKAYGSGHWYFSLKDANATLPMVAFGWGRRNHPFLFKDGIEVVCRGKITVYAGRGGYQMVVERMDPVGAGALQIAFDQLKAKLASEGLFDQSRKRNLPAYPQSIAVVTSPTGAVIQDMLNILSRRAPHIRVTVVPTAVQGVDAPPQIEAAIRLANHYQLGDIIVVARGGGSMEDLWSFNDERVARTIAGSALPVISAVGHEVDFTIADFVADLRAPTPSAAAEIISQQWVEAQGALLELRERLLRSMRRDLDIRKRHFDLIASRLLSPRDKLREQSQRCDELTERLDRAVRMRLDRARLVLAEKTSKLQMLSPLQVLNRGYALVQRDARSDSEGRPAAGSSLVRSASEVNRGEGLKIRFHDGLVGVTVDE